MLFVDKMVREIVALSVCQEQRSMIMMRADFSHKPQFTSWYLNCL